MERNWTAQEEDRPAHLRTPRSRFPWPALLLVAVVAAGLGVGYYYTTTTAEPPASAPVARPEPAEPPSTRPAEPPAIRYPLAAPQAEQSAKPLPPLDQSDAMMRDSLASLMGAKPFSEMVVPTELVRRIVATVDNLPRPTAPRRAMPLNPVPGRFAVAGEAAAAGAPEQASIDAANFSRYVPYVRALESTEPRALVFGYVRAYPLFQRAYEELGYPGRYFNDRLIEAIDDLLAAPEIDGPVRLVRTKVLYEFADPDLEGRSAGQKIMLRMGRDNAARVKARLRDIRQALVAATDRRK